MKISYNWLKSYIPQIPDPKELERVLTFHVTEIEEVVPVMPDLIRHPENSSLDSGSRSGMTNTQEPTDWIFDLKILPDRAGDLLCHLGVARELSGLLGLEFVDPTPQYKIPASLPTNLEIAIQTDKCRRYMGRIVRNVKVGPSPDWVVTYLASIGQRSINNIVDASNMVMFDCGQPTHAFDLKKLASEKIIVREADSELDFPVVGSENIVAKVKPGDIVIADTDSILALAGIKGGTNSGISIDAPYTTDILLEVANFDPTSVRKTGQRLSLLSDARKRFENSVPVALGDYAMREFSALILEMCPDAVFEDIVDECPVKQEEKKVSFTTAIMNEKLGLTLTPAGIATILQNYKYSYVEELGNFIVHIPYWRQDITGIHDMVDEIGRIYGYDKIVPTLPVFPTGNTHDEIYLKIQAVKNDLIQKGYSEVMNYTFGKKGDVQVARGPKGKDFLRTNLTDGMKECFEKNKLHAPLLGMTDVQLFEIGTVFTKDNESIHVAIAHKKGVEEMTLDEYVEKNNLDFKTLKLDELSTSDKNNFVAWSAYPFITRDVSFWADREITEEKFITLVGSTLGTLSVRTPYMIDQFTKDGRHSYAFRFVFQSYEKTLTDEDITGEWSKILEVLKIEGFEIR
jgi:phenylalanyl-tRNA synthetase beta subunit